MPLSRFSRRQKISEAKSEKKLIYAVVLGIIVFVLLLFYGVPVLINMSVFISNFSHRGAVQVQETSSSGVLFPPTLQPLPEATNSATIEVSGIADKNETVTLFQNSELLDTQPASRDGTFLFPNVNLKPGQNTFTAKATGFGKDSGVSSPISILYKNSAPQLEITSPQDNATVSGDNKFVTITGKTDFQNMLTINDHIAVVNPDGSFSYQQSLNDGDNTIRITVKDSAGNQTSTEIHVKYSSS